jgi:uncharacterized protein YjiS (DUF1127 family)
MLDKPSPPPPANEKTASQPRFRNQSSVYSGGGGTGLLRKLFPIRQLQRLWRSTERAYKARKLRRSIHDLDERLMKDVGIPPEQIRAVLARRYAWTDPDFR